MDRPTLEDFRHELDDRMAATLGAHFGKPNLSFQSQANDVADGTAVLLLRDKLEKPCAVVLCAAPAAPDMVRRSVHAAREAKKILGPSIGTHILEPLLEGTLKGLSYAVMPYCNPLSNSRPVWWIQRRLLCPSILHWLASATEHTMHDPEPAGRLRSFAEPLQAVASFSRLNKRMRSAAELAALRLESKDWHPKHVLMHGDFWKGNILIKPESPTNKRQSSADRFVVIDWPGSEIHGYAIFDLIRMAQSLQLSKVKLRAEIAAHCKLLECTLEDAMSYLLAALGHIAMHIEHFPVDAYVRMAESGFATLEENLN